MFKATIILAMLLSISITQDCFGSQCQHRANIVESSSLTHKEIGLLLEQEIRRQFWYYLRDSQLLSEANLQLSGRLLIFYFHRSMAGTFFTIASYYDDEKYSQINTLVRLGNANGLRGNTNPADIEPFTLGFRLNDETPTEITMADGELTVDGMVVELLEIEDNEQMQAKCKELSDHFLRQHYWNFLRGAILVNGSSLKSSGNYYHILTYINVVGTFLAITSCDGEMVETKNLVRIGKGSPNPEAFILQNPEPLG